MSAYTALTAAGYRAQVRDRTTLFFTFAFPLLFLVVFGLIFRGQDVEQSGLSYISYTAAGVLSWGWRTPPCSASRSPSCSGGPTTSCG